MDEDINKILVVSKSTKHCLKAMHFGISLARKYDARLFVIHIIHNPFGLKGWNLPIASLPQLEKEYKKMFEDAKKDLDRIIQKERADGMDITEVIKEGDPEKEILEIVETEDIDLIVMRAYEEGRIEHLIFGRDREALLRKMPCSLLFVHDTVHYK